MGIMTEAVLSFIGTNIDNIFILVALYLTVGNNYSKRDIVVGQAIGMIILIVISYILSIGTQIIPTEYLSWLGLIPIFMGLKEGFNALKKSGGIGEEAYTDDFRNKEGLVKIIAIAIACGADNVGVHVSLFSKYSINEIGIFALVFVSLIPLLCFLAEKVSMIPILHKKISRYQKYLVPLVFIFLGIYIILK